MVDLDKGFISRRMVLNTLGIGKTMRKMGKENYSIVMETHTKDSFKTV